jgi:hypothetical protein
MELVKIKIQTIRFFVTVHGFLNSELKYFGNCLREKSEWFKNHIIFWGTLGTKGTWGTLGTR